MILVIFMKVLKNSIQIKKRKTLFVFDDIIPDTLTILLWEFQNKQEVHQIAFNPSSNIDFQDFMSIYKKCTTKQYSILVTDTILA